MALVINDNGAHEFALRMPQTKDDLTGHQARWRFDPRLNESLGDV